MGGRKPVVNRLLLNRFHQLMRLNRETMVSAQSSIKEDNFMDSLDQIPLFLPGRSGPPVQDNKFQLFDCSSSVHYCLQVNVYLDFLEWHSSTLLP